MVPSWLVLFQLLLLETGACSCSLLGILEDVISFYVVYQNFVDNANVIWETCRVQVLCIIGCLGL